VQWFNSIFVNFLFDWQAGGRYLWNPEVTNIQDRIYVDAVNYWNLDMRVSKTFNLAFGSVELVATFKNLTNNKFLTVSNMTRPQLDAYKSSLTPPNKGGDDKWGSYDAGPNAGGHIDTGWWEAPIFLNPRMILFGARLNF
jgi:hypothetical protein